MNLGERSESINRFIEGVREASQRAPENCETVDVQALEDVSKSIANNIENYIVNIDLSNA